ncbi:MAG: Na+/H+ antiporter NhaC family protein [Prevotellaceae bacterium]|nr:Na+/H+ antiporter NhaC family protein [Prevotellaceae bacterium]
MQKKPPFIVSLIPIVALIILMYFSVDLFGSDSLCGGTQICILMAVAVCIGISRGFYKVKWRFFEAGIKKNLGEAAIPIMILLMIGMMSGTWMISGVVPTFIYYGVQIMSPKYFLLCTCIVCAVISVLSGSSWTTIATIGIAFLGIGNALGISEWWTAGAIISGAYFGDKISPLSDTTVLASSSAGVDLFVHIRYMLVTTVPAFCIGLIIYAAYGFINGDEATIHIEEYLNGLDAKFNISLWTMIVPLATGFLVYRKVPSIIALFISGFLGGICALIMQPDLLCEIAADAELSRPMSLIKGVMQTMFGPTSLEMNTPALTDLVSTNGMSGILDTIWLILCAMTFGGAMMASGMIDSIASFIIKGVRNRFTLVSSTVTNGVIMNLTASDQYLSILLTNNLFGEVYKRNGYENRLLSRSTEDSATVTSVLIPWNSCGMTQSTVLGVPTIVYLPFCFFNYLSPLMSIIVAAIGYKIKKVKP